MAQEKLRILVIEDNPADFRLLRELLSENPSADFELTQTESFKQGLSLLSAKKFDTLLLDLNLPDGKGLENIDKVKSANPEISIIVLTGLDDEKIGIDALQKGVQDYLVKGKIQSELLAKSIRYAIQRHKIEEALRIAHDQLELKVEERTRQFLEANKQLNMEIMMRRDREEQIHARNLLLTILGRASSRKEYADSVVSFLSKWAHSRCVGIRLLNEEGKIPYESYIGFDKEFWESENWLSLKNDECACTRVMRGKPEPVDMTVMTQGGSFYLSHSSKFLESLCEEDKRKFRGVCIKRGFNSIAVIPLYYRDKIIGAIHFADEEENKLEPKTIEFIESMGGLIAEGIYKFNLEDRIRKDHNFLDAFFNHASTPFVFLDRDFNFIRVNEAYAKAGRKKVSDFPGHNHFEFYPNEETEAIFREVVETKKSFQAFAKPFVFPEDSKHRVNYWDWSLVPVLNKENEVDFLVFSLMDVTERRVAEERLVRTQEELMRAKRLSDIGTLAATVAHELRNPLAAIRMAAYNIKKKAESLPIDSHLANIEKKITESNQIITNLLFYSRLKAPHFEETDIYGCIDDCIASLPKDNSYKLHIGKDLKKIKNIYIQADPLQMKELFSNILNNAIDAVSGKKGEVTIEAALQQDRYVRICIKDNGMGMDAEQVRSIFEPFYTTKAKGTGLGMTVCKQIVSLHSGIIEVASKKEEGTRVTILLPLRQNI